MRRRPNTDPPLLGNADGKLVRKAFSPSTVRSIQTDDLATIGNSCSAIGAALKAYGDLIDRADAKPGGGRAMLTRTEDEIALGMAAANICAQRSFRAAEAFVSTLPQDRRTNARNGLKMMRQGAALTITGALIIFHPSHQSRPPSRRSFRHWTKIRRQSRRASRKANGNRYGRKFLDIRKSFLRSRGNRLPP